MRPWINSSPRLRKKRTQYRLPYRLAVEELEDRCLLAAPVIDQFQVIPNFPLGKSIVLPVTASDPSGGSISWTVTSSSPNFTVTQSTTNTYLLINTTLGSMEFQLFNDLTPQTVAIITGLVNSGFYNGSSFSRIVPNFVIQGGEPKAGAATPPSFNDEFNASLIYTGKGQLGLANAGPDTNSSQFFATLGPERILDFNQAIFGQLVRGFDVLANIDAQPNSGSPNNTATPPIPIISAQIVQDNTDAVFLLKNTSTTEETATLTFTATASDGGTTVHLLTVNALTEADVAKSTNQPVADDPPFLGPISNQVTPKNTPITFALSSTELEGDPVTYEAILQGNSTANATATVTGNMVTVTPSANFSGLLSLLVGVEQTGATSRGSASGLFDTQLINVQVGDLALTGGAATTFTATEGASASGTVATFTDQDTTSNASQFKATINWGDGSALDTTSAVITGSAGNYTVAGTHTYAQDGAYPVQVVVSDTGNTGVDTGGALVTINGTANVADAALTATGVSVTATQGIASSATVATFTDANPNGAASDFTATINWGDNTTTSGTVTATSAGFAVTGSHVYLKAGSFTVTTTIKDVHNTINVVPSSATATSTAAVAPLQLAAQGVDVSALQEILFSNTVVATLTVGNNPNAQPTDFTATINWGDNTTSAGTVEAGSNGGFQVVSDHTYSQAGSFAITTTITLASTANTASPITTMATSTATVQSLGPNQLWVNRAFLHILGRTSTDSERQAWSNLIAGGVTLPDAALSIERSPEGFDHTVETLYQKYLGRDVDPDGLASSIHFLQSFHTIEQLSAILLASEEYFSATGKGNGSNSTWLGSVFKDALGRNIDPGTLTQLSQALTEGTSRLRMALFVLYTQEGQAVRFENMYQAELDRLPSSKEVNTQATFEQQGARDELLIAGMIGSSEFFDGAQTGAQ
jgi:cyclophilin family peptidyl-prolyl cis-trans isomerase